MTPKEALYGFDALWAELKAAADVARLRSLGVTPTFCARSRSEVIADMIRHCDEAFALYEAKAASDRDEYRAALWMRRAYLLRRGETHRIYDGKDALEWRKAHEAGKTNTGRQIGMVPA